MSTHRREIWDQIFCSKYLFLASSIMNYQNGLLHSCTEFVDTIGFFSHKLKGFGYSDLKLDFFWPGWYLILKMVKKFPLKELNPQDFYLNDFISVADEWRIFYHNNHIQNIFFSSWIVVTRKYLLCRYI